MYKIIRKKLGGDFEIQQGQLFRVHNFERGEGQDKNNIIRQRQLTQTRKKAMVKTTWKRL